MQKIGKAIKKRAELPEIVFGKSDIPRPHYPIRQELKYQPFATALKHLIIETKKEGPDE